MEKIAQASAQVADLQAALKQEQVGTRDQDERTGAAPACRLTRHVGPPHPQIIVEEKKAATDNLIASIGREKAVVDEAVEAGRGDEEAAAALQVTGIGREGGVRQPIQPWLKEYRIPFPPALQTEVQNFQKECTQDLSAAEPVIAEAEAALNR